jgi:hypothetical protein
MLLNYNDRKKGDNTDSRDAMLGGSESDKNMKLKLISKDHRVIIRYF